MMDRSSRPNISPNQTAAADAARTIALRRQRLSGKHIAMEVGVSPATVSRVIKRAGLSRIKDLDPPQPIIRYQYAEPGGLIHLDIKRLGRFERVGHRITGNRTGQGKSRGIGWEYVHVYIDDASRIAFTDIFPDEKAVSAVAFLKAAIAYYRRFGITVSRVMTDNGSCYRASDFAEACQALGLKHIRTKPYTPKTNGKAERFIQTALREWAYARAYPSSESRKSHLPDWTHMYNWHRPHGSLNSKPATVVSLSTTTTTPRAPWISLFAQSPLWPRVKGKQLFGTLPGGRADARIPSPSDAKRRRRFFPTWRGGESSRRDHFHGNPAKLIFMLRDRQGQPRSLS
jgi:transposase InsO family protein